MGGGKAQQFSDRFLVGVIFRRAFFQHQTELFQKVWYFSALSFASFSSICRTRLVRALRRLRVTVLSCKFHGRRSTAGH